MPLLPRLKHPLLFPDEARQVKSRKLCVFGGHGLRLVGKKVRKRLRLQHPKLLPATADAIAPSGGELQPREVGVEAVPQHQFGMCAGLDDTPLVHDHDVVVAQHLAVAPALPDEDGGVYKSENTAMD